jgi:outer membrane protein OmpA-like peptidoglycan-associated protein
MKKTVVTACILAFGVVAMGVASPANAQNSARNNEIDKTAIIRSLAPIKYLPQHSGQARAIDLDIEFKTASAKLTHRARRQLDIVAEALQDRKLVAEQFRIIGHTDASGAANMNLSLSKRRAKAVFDYLVVHRKISKDRLKPDGLGETRLKNPIVPTSGENRRVEFVLVQSIRNKSSSHMKSGTEKVIKW